MKASPLLMLVLILTACFTLATSLASRAVAWSNRDEPQRNQENEPLAARAVSWSNRTNANNVFSLLFGDGRRMFANQFFTMADVYFHSGYYPSIFDLRDEGTKAIVSASHGNAESEADEKKEDFLGKPKDWISRFGRHFRITEHTHLEHSHEREILPWLRLAADTDPQKIETYTVGAYFLCQHLHQPQEAEAFLREGLRNNPGNYEILFGLGRIYYQNYHDLDHARNVWQLALINWMKQDSAAQKENKLGFEEITVNLANLEREAGRYEDAINWFQAAQKVSPSPETLQQQIDEIKAKLAAQTNAPPALPH
jgi:tetratricopeptide (TPR) repeat protein